ncbi:cupin domain-containing protein [Leucobacter sp. USCH14]|uniref:cupin domain-containing protein n=1 Tax=Leucobacter sp. USCH14 TaxID=3024838 RepID=UPI0030AF44E5
MSELLPEGRNAALHGTRLDVALDAVDAEETVAGSPHQGIAELGGIGGAELGVWELRGGTVTDTEVDEIFIVLSGGASIELLEVPGAPEEAGRVFDVAAGDIMRLAAGTRTRWTVTDHIRKVYVAEASGE